MATGVTVCAWKSRRTARNIMNDLPSTVVNDLITLGSLDDRPAVEKEQLLSRLKPFGHVNSLGWERWNEIAAVLPEDDLRNLVCGLTVAEVELNWYGGSVAAVIWAYRCYESRFPEKAAPLADWVLARSENPFLPFGSTPPVPKSDAKFESYDTYFLAAVKKPGASQPSAMPPTPIRPTQPPSPPNPGK